MIKIDRNFWTKVWVYILGLAFMSIGVTFAINSHLGISPVNSLPYIISLVSGIDMGISVILIYSVYVLIQILILKKEFKVYYLSQLIFSVIYGRFIDIFLNIVGDFAFPGYMGKLFMLAISIFFVSLGLSLYTRAELVSMPMEQLINVLVYKNPKYEFHEIKIKLDVLVVSASVLISILYFRRLVGIREGTIISALLVGRIMPYTNKLTDPLVRRIEKQK